LLHKNQTLDISIVICCYNSEKRLPETLYHLFSQVISKEILWEIIIVDNNSTDNTRHVALEEWRKYSTNTNFRIMDEPKAGLSYARAKGIAKAEGKYILFCDDDNWLDSNYVQQAVEIMESNPKIGMLGGKGTAISDIKLPYWFEKYQSCYAVGSQNNFSGDITSNKGAVYGAGCILRKEIWNKIKNSNVHFLLTDRKGNKITSGGDSEMCYLIAASGYQIHYANKLIFKHFIDPSRLTIQYLKKFYQGQATSFEIICSYKSWISRCKNVRGYRRTGIDLISSFFQSIFLLLIPSFIRRLSHSTELRFTYHKHRMIQIFKEYKTYPEIHVQVERNIKIASSVKHELAMSEYIGK
jgi:glycosyltransferase involved in cell wall biosynthesis